MFRKNVVYKYLILFIRIVACVARCSHYEKPLATEKSEKRASSLLLSHDHFRTWFTEWEKWEELQILTKLFFPLISHASKFFNLSKCLNNSKFFFHIWNFSHYMFLQPINTKSSPTNIEGFARDFSTLNATCHGLFQMAWSFLRNSDHFLAFPNQTDCALF